MDDRLAGVAAAVVGVALVAVGIAEYVAPGFPPPPPEPLATGVLVVGAGLALLAAGTLAVRTGLDHLALRIATGLGLLALALAVLQPSALLFGGVFWLGLVFAVLVGAGAVRTVGHVR
ncbi:hypothetical protein [Natronomonas marina]|jgi:hypothetical protein|uniref:hypothetical protein n=1 Tax=Natronomonas marina TaxID=2961939 RepID=UPI0020C95BCF|nr:hypothetical protein [Natronomonas marina]